MKEVRLPFNAEIIDQLHSGDNLLLSGILFVARDAAHKKLVELINCAKPLPFDIRGQTIYYMGPSPARPGRVIGAAGPTTSGRMDTYSPLLLEKGLRGMIGKGQRSHEVIAAMIRYRAVYLGAIGGAGALISQSITRSDVIAFEELGAESLRCLEVRDFPVTVINDIYGGDLYREGRAAYRT